MPQDLTLFSGWFGYAIFAFSFLIFLSYQVIPWGLKVIEQHAGSVDGAPFLVSVTSSPVFRAFIRLCGIEHIIVSSVILSAENEIITVDPFWQWLLVSSQAAVAFVSIMAALSVWRVRWYLLK